MSVQEWPAWRFGVGREVSWGGEHILAGRVRGPSPDEVRRHPHQGSVAQQDRRCLQGKGRTVTPRAGALGDADDKQVR